MSRWPIAATALLLAPIFCATLISAEVVNVSAGEATPDAATASIVVADPFPADIPVDGASLGAPDAPVTVEVWIDYTCPGCKRLALEVVPRLVTDFVGPGDARLIVRDYPFRGPGAVRAAEAAVCAAEQGAFWPYHNTLFLNQEGPAEGFSYDRLREMARALVLDSTTFDDCLANGDKRGAVERSIAEARAQGIDSVPTVLVNGAEVVIWSDPVAIGDAIEQARAIPTRQAEPVASPVPPGLASPTRPPDLPGTPAPPGPPVGLELLFDASPSDGTPLDNQSALAIRDSLERRIDALGLSGGVWRRADDQILIRIDATHDPARVVYVLASPTLFEIIDPRGALLPPGTKVATTLGPPQSQTAETATPVAAGTDAAEIAAPANPVYETIVSGDDLRDVYVTIGSDGVTPVVGFELQGDGPSRLYRHTSRHVGEPMSIVIDKRVISSPIITGAISGHGIIEGIPPDAVADLVARLEAGALPDSVVLVESRVIPARGTESGE